jgi:hypothetical protein
VTGRQAIGLAVGPLLAAGALSALPAAADPLCSVFDQRPCAPALCDLSSGEPCLPDYGAPIGQDLRLSIDARADAAPAVRDPNATVDSIAALFAALRGCVSLPPTEKGHAGTELTLRLSFTRGGTVIGRPQLTYVTPGTPGDIRDDYRNAIVDGLTQCMPLPFSPALGGAVAGRPIAIRYTDNRRETP